jgi:hypothetical protein
LVTGIETLITYLGNILKHPTNSRYFTIRKSNRIYRKAFEGFENETHEFLAFLGCSHYVPCHLCTLFKALSHSHHTGFQTTFSPSHALTSQNLEVPGDGLDSSLTLPIDFCWEMLSEAHRILNDYRKLPNIERWHQIETEVEKKNT